MSYVAVVCRCRVSLSRSSRSAEEEQEAAAETREEAEAAVVGAAAAEAVARLDDLFAGGGMEEAHGAGAEGGARVAEGVEEDWEPF